MAKKSAIDSAAKSLFIIMFILVAIYFFGNVIMPIIFAGLASITLLPITSFWERLGLSKGLSAFITVLLISILIIGVLIVIGIQSQEIIKKLPKPTEGDEDFLNVHNLPIISETFQSYINEHMDTIRQGLKNLKGTLLSLLQGSFIGIKNTLLFLVTCPIYIFFMLVYRDNVFKFIEAYYSRGKNDGQGKKIIEDVKDSLFHYLKGLIIVMLVIFTLTSIGLFALGIDHAFFFGTVAAVLAPIPYIGVVVSALFPLIVTLITKDSAWYGLGVIGIFAVVQFLEGNFITPKIMGNSVNINPLIILLAIVVFGSLAGILGIILTVPLLAVIKVVVEHYDHLKPWTYLLEDRKSD